MGDDCPCSSWRCDIVSSEDDDDDEQDYEPSEEPSWAKKLKQKMKKLFCLQAMGQYKAHVAEKKARCRDKAIMR